MSATAAAGVAWDGFLTINWCGRLLVAADWSGVCTVPLVDIASGPPRLVDLPVFDGKDHVGDLSLTMVLQQVATVTVSISQVSWKLSGGDLTGLRNCEAAKKLEVGHNGVDFVRALLKEPHADVATPHQKKSR